MSIHRNSALHVAEEGEFGAATSTLPVLQYYPVRGRAEPIRCGLHEVLHELLRLGGSPTVQARLAWLPAARQLQRAIPAPHACCRLTLAYQRQAWYEPPVEPIDAIKRRQLDGYPFRQLPRFIDEGHGEVDLVQSLVGRWLAGLGAGGGCRGAGSGGTRRGSGAGGRLVHSRVHPGR
jgi:glutathione S-transferase